MATFLKPFPKYIKVTEGPEVFLKQNKIRLWSGAASRGGPHSGRPLGKSPSGAGASLRGDANSFCPSGPHLPLTLEWRPVGAKQGLSAQTPAPLHPKRQRPEGTGTGRARRVEAPGHARWEARPCAGVHDRQGAQGAAFGKRAAAPLILRWTSHHPHPAPPEVAAGFRVPQPQAEVSARVWGHLRPRPGPAPPEAWGREPEGLGH